MHSHSPNLERHIDMAKVDLKGLSLSELKSLQKRIEKAIERHDAKQKAAALAALKSKAKELGFSLDELTGGTPSKAKAKPAKKAPRPATHRDPKNPKNTWSGRGARPKWLKEALDSGKSLDDFKI